MWALSDEEYIQYVRSLKRIVHPIEKCRGCSRLLIGKENCSCDKLLHTPLPDPFPRVPDVGIREFSRKSYSVNSLVSLGATYTTGEQGMQRPCVYFSKENKLSAGLHVQGQTRVRVLNLNDASSDNTFRRMVYHEPVGALLSEFHLSESVLAFLM